MKELKISSMIDVITNSSTEVFTIYNDESLAKLKEAINAIMAAGCKDDNPVTFDDVFEIKLTYDEDTIVDLIDNYSDKSYDATTEEERLEFAKHYDDENRWEGYPAINGYSITLKEGIEDNEKLKSARQNIDNLFNIFETYTAYC